MQKTGKMVSASSRHLTVLINSAIFGEVRMDNNDYSLGDRGLFILTYYSAYRCQKIVGRQGSHNSRHVRSCD